MCKWTPSITTTHSSVLIEAAACVSGHTVLQLPTALCI